jgi:hypothetical protein
VYGVRVAIFYCASRVWCACVCELFTVHLGHGVRVATIYCAFCV